MDRRVPQDAGPNVGGTTGVRYALVPLSQGTGALFFIRGPAGRDRFLLLSSLKDVSYRPCGAAGALFLFYLCRLAGGGAFFSRERKEATILRRPHRVAAQN